MMGRIAGANASWYDELDGDLDTRPSELFPPVIPPIAKQLSRLERTQVARYRTLRDRVHEGPLYTELGENVAEAKKATSSAATADPFTSMPTYGMKYMKKRRKIPRLDTRPYVLRLFPAELWSTLDPHHEKSDVPGSKKRKRLMISTNRTGALDDLEAADEEEDVDDMERKKRAIDNVPEVEEEDDEDKALDEEPEEEDVDDDFSEDDDDMGGDYNAENYFDDGGDDAADDWGDDDGGGGGDYY
ncbi:hypothetical protein L228DRAFT_247219 [Xylona heveae TC161]|uniref:DNA-directed RNA polymerase III subunit n=1 Tax=Xylona heveae (strain CBS 132557 / TC161) TaxID=1328760 RepID=A0A165H079_XYLHT|nr:hypothetical protein L228DRAFT_247219 [Xylona heveae TC161]KZF22823.1 hypothetical protein L228DRAFT_247219 [Xylona heveae TC161]